MGGPSPKGDHRAWGWREQPTYAKPLSAIGPACLGSLVEFCVAGTSCAVKKGWEVKPERSPGARMRGLSYCRLSRVRFTPSTSGKWRFFKPGNYTSSACFQHAKGVHAKGGWEKGRKQQTVWKVPAVVQAGDTEGPSLSPAGEPRVGDAFCGRRGRAAAWGESSVFAWGVYGPFPSDQGSLLPTPRRPPQLQPAAARALGTEPPRHCLALGPFRKSTVSSW